MKLIRQYAVKCARYALAFTAAAQGAAMAALPNIPAPSGGGIGGAPVQDGDWLSMMGAYFKVGLTLLGLVLAALAFISVITGAMRRWKEYSSGQVQLGELKEFLIVGVVVVIFVIMMVNYAIQTLA